MSVQPRDRLIETALALFAAEGFHAVGIDRVLREAGVAKMTLYNHFGSKDDLIVAALERRDADYRRWIDAEVARAPGGPGAQRLAAYIDAVERWTARGGFNGCAFVNAAAEFGAPDHPVHRAALQHKQAMFDYVAGLVEAAGTADVRAVTLQVRALCEGAVVLKQITGSSAAFEAARAALPALLGARRGA